MFSILLIYMLMFRFILTSDNLILYCRYTRY